MTQQTIELELSIRPIPPDSNADVEHMIRSALQELAETNNKIQSPPSIRFERRAPIGETAAGTMASIQILLKHIPELIPWMKLLLNYLGSKLKDAEVVDVTLKIHDQTVILKSPSEENVHLQLGDNFELRYQPKRKHKKADDGIK
jgi:hypothetical protein